ncbi:uncharacterized protein, partial [Haliotis cracherodii]|uniref:uncharacterized protein n=1 Tax=Haliotis cracherodii TaxID=6455 RepID=UPI0039E83F46
SGLCFSQMAPPPGQAASAGMAAAGGMGGAGTLGGAGVLGGVGGIPPHLLGDPGENPFALDGMCWNLEKQLRATLPPNTSPKEMMADKVQLAITSFLNGGGEIPSTGGGNIACVIRNAKKKAGKMKVMNADLATVVADRVADAGCRIPCFDATTGMWAQPPPGMAPASLTPALTEPMTASHMFPRHQAPTYDPRMGAVDPYGTTMAGPGPYEVLRSREMGAVGSVDPGMGGMGSMGPGPYDPATGAGPYDPSMGRGAPYDPGMGRPGPYDPSMGTSGPYDPSMGPVGPYDPSMGPVGPYDPSMGAAGPYDPSMGPPGPYDPRLVGGAGPYDQTMAGSGPYDPSVGGPGPYDPGPGAFDQGFGGHYPGRSGMGTDPYPADVAPRSTSSHDRGRGLHTSHQMALHERRRMGLTHRGPPSQMDMGPGFREHPLSRNNPTNHITGMEQSSRHLSSSIADTQLRGSSGQQSGFANADQTGAFLGGSSGSGQSMSGTGTNPLLQDTARFSAGNMASTDPTRPAVNQFQRAILSDGVPTPNLASSQAISGSGSGTNAMQASGGTHLMGDPAGSQLGQTQRMLSQSATQLATSRQSQFASDHAGFTFDRKQSANQMTPTRVSSGMSQQPGGLSQDFANARLQSGRRDFRDLGLMSDRRMSHPSREASLFSENPRSSRTMSHSSDMMTHPNWRMTDRSNSHAMRGETSLGSSRRSMQAIDRHPLVGTGSSFDHSSRRMSWDSPRSSDRMSSFSHQSMSPSFPKSRMAQISRVDTRGWGTHSPSRMNSHFNDQARFVSSAVGSTTKIFSRRPTINSVHETPGVAEVRDPKLTGNNGAEFAMTSPVGLGGISPDALLRKKQTLSTFDTQKDPKVGTVGSNSLTQGTTLSDRNSFHRKTDLPLKQNRITGNEESTQPAKDVLLPNMGRSAQGSLTLSQELSHDGTSLKNGILGRTGSEMTQTTKSNGDVTKLGLNNNRLHDSITGSNSGRDTLMGQVSNTDLNAESVPLRNTLQDGGQKDPTRQSEQGRSLSNNALGSDAPHTDLSVMSPDMLTENSSSGGVGDVLNKAKGLDSRSGSTFTSGKQNVTDIVDGGRISDAELLTKFRPPIVISAADINSPVRDPHIDRFGGRLRITQSLGANDKLIEKGLSSGHGGNLRLDAASRSQFVSENKAAMDMLTANQGQSNIQDIQLAVQRLGGGRPFQTLGPDRASGGVVDTGLGHADAAIGMGTGPIDTLHSRQGAGMDTRSGHPMGDRHATHTGFRDVGRLQGPDMGMATDVGFGHPGPFHGAEMGLRHQMRDRHATDMGFGNAAPFPGPDVGLGNPWGDIHATNMGSFHGPDVGLGANQGMGVGFESHHSTHQMVDPNHAMGPDPFLLSLL